MSDRDRDQFLFEMRMGFAVMSPRTSHSLLPKDGLPAPLRERAEAMDNAKTDDEARAAASEFLTVSEEWLP